MGKLTIYMYPPCSTCKKAVKWGRDNGIHWEEVHIVEHPPTAEQLMQWADENNLPLKSFFNTSGKKYRELQLKDKLPTMTENEKATLLSSDGMLIKRPIITNGVTVTVGFKEEVAQATWLD
ncbi:arsenate reductase family protein [Aureibacillus halotolerans]|uniref:Arsenate reductase n=1 Tax=Aureibacillus halotolerans TaxID=1508390 RepID=A0A4R6U4P6_9BACI|nr:arsenate reductase family protein [Aureibacillus halotolerans]TDQ40472.1 arsenate reductase [Aureibacillus halotolerans]